MNIKGEDKQGQPTLVQIATRSQRRADEEGRIAEYHKLRDRMAGLGGLRGREYWRSLEELADTPEFRHYIQNEFPEQAAEFIDPTGRRRFLKLMGASLALAGVGVGAACSYQPPELLVPYVRQPEQVVPGKELFFATAMPHGAIGLLARSSWGRPTKAEGNPDHPASLGHTDIFGQASVLQLFDPDRSKIVIERGGPSSWSSFLGDLRPRLEALRAGGGAGLRILTATVYSPTLARQLRELLAELPQARWFQYEPCSRDNVRAGAVQAFGQPVNTVYRFDLAARVFSVDSEFLAAQGGANLRYAHDYITARTPAGDRPDINNTLGNELARLYAVECEPKQTGAKADHRMPLRPSQVESFVRAAAAAVGVAGLDAGTTTLSDQKQAQWIAALARDLQANRGRGIVIVGEAMPPSVHALGHAMNAALGNIGTTVFHTDPVEFSPTDQLGELRELVGEMNAGKVQMLIIAGGNPAYTAPADLHFGDALDKVPWRAHHGLYDDETAERCHWHIPQTHFYEEWSDVRAFDGTVSIVQPLINPLYQGRSIHELIAAFSSRPETNSYEIVRTTHAAARPTNRAAAAPQQADTARADTARAGTTRAPQSAAGSPSNRQTDQQAGQQASPGTGSQAGQPGNPQSDQRTASGSQIAPAVGQQLLSGEGGRVVAPRPETGGGDFEQRWRRMVHDGVVPDTAFPLRTLPLAASFPQSLSQSTNAPTGNQPSGTLEIMFRPDPTIHDGRYANNGWLQELPKPLTTLTWDNAAIISPRTAERLGLRMEFVYSGGGDEVDVVKLNFDGAEIEAPVWILPGQPDDAVTVHLGHGRWRAGNLGTGTGFNAYQLRNSNAMWHGAGLQIVRAGRRMLLASTQVHFAMEGREPVRVATIDDYRARPEQAFQEHLETPREGELSLYPEYNYPYHKWGMAIDNNACIGCNACVVACQSENNIPVVGKAQVLRSREMHWLRIDTYHGGENTNEPEGTYFEPLMCVHCEKAPCEPVCPVHATVHDAEGLNVMVYNRCIGTRYCSNNCPYKVRRFNFLLYQDWDTETLKMARNPEVTVRSRGVMEKCTYCVQRTQEAKITASKEGRKVRDGEVVTACQAVCPTEAIVFGDLNDPEAQVTRIRATTKRAYPLLGELGTQPRTHHLGALRNPNPELEPPLAREQRKTPNTSAQEGVKR